MYKFSLGFLLLLSVLLVSLVNGSAEIVNSVEVKSVIDGVSFSTITEDIFKLADVETRCTDWDNSTGLISSKSFLASFIEGKTVYLDIDSQYKTDIFGRHNKTVVVVYVDHNATHYINVNQVIVEHGLLLIDDYENDFNPESWSRYVKKEVISDFSGWIVIPILSLSTLIFIKYRKNLT
jgi:hypothetical protein